MNIFVLDLDPNLAARYHCDKHVVKMITETAQILSTALQNAGVEHEDLYRKTHPHHPCVLWAAESRANFAWLNHLLVCLLGEYDQRYAKPEKFERARRMVSLFSRLMWHLPDGELTPFAQAMPDHYRSDDPVAAYRFYYKMDKEYLAKWKCGAPEWWTEG